MADSRTEQIIQAIVTALDGEGKPAGVTVNRSRRQSVAPDELPMLSVYPVSEKVQTATENRRSPVVTRNFVARIRCRAAGLDDQLDPLRQLAVAALNANPSLGGLALGVFEEEATWAAADASDDDFSVCELDFRIWYATARGDLTKPA